MPLEQSKGDCYLKGNKTMKRIALTDGSGCWFDEDRAEEFSESTWWDGKNNVSYATGSDREHEWLYRTQGGKWILRWSSQYQGVSTTVDEIDDKTAAAWLVRSNHEPHAACGEQFAALEIT